MTRSEVIKDLKFIQGHLKKGLFRANKLATELEIPMHHELEFIVQEVEKLLEMSKTVKKGK